MDYFVSSVVFDEQKFLNPDGQMIGGINSKRGMENFSHSANCIFRRSNDEIIAIRCNCGRGVYHPFINGIVYWSISIKLKRIRKNNASLLGDIIYREIKKKCVEEE